MKVSLGETNAFPRIVSVDDHVIEPPTVWIDRLPARLRDEGPRVERLPAGELRLEGARYVERPGTSGPPVDYWVYDGRFQSLKRAVAAAGRAPRRHDHDGRPRSTTSFLGCYEPGERLADMDRNWTDASLCFPNFPRFCGQTFLEASDKDLALLCVRAYNDWMVEEWAASSGGRLVPLCLVPLWDAGLAAAEVRRNAARGVRAVTLQRDPSVPRPPEHPQRHWDRFFAACAETGTVLCLHIGSGTKMPSTSPDAPLGVHVTIGFGNCMASLADFLFSGKLRAVPRTATDVRRGSDRLDPLPARARRRRVGAAPGVDRRRRIDARAAVDVLLPPGLRLLLPRPPRPRGHLRSVGVDNVMFEVDYPHSDSTWPDSKAVAMDLMAGLPESTVTKLVRGNAISLLGLDLT